MRNERVLYRVLHVAHDAKCFLPSVYSSSTTIRQLYSTTKMPTYGSYEYKKEGPDTGPNRKQGLVETDS